MTRAWKVVKMRSQDASDACASELEAKREDGDAREGNLLVRTNGGPTNAELLSLGFGLSFCLSYTEVLMVGCSLMKGILHLGRR